MLKLVKNTALVLLLGALATTPALAAGKNWKVSLANLPGLADNKDKGLLVDMIKAMAKATGDTVEIQVVPFARSISDVTDAKVDFHAPLIQLPGMEEGTASFDYSTETPWHVNFVLYSTKGLDITPATVGKFKVETDTAHVGYFDFPVTASSFLEGSIKKVNAGRLDAVIFADVNIDPLIHQAKLTQLKRQLYKRFDNKFVLPKGKRGGAADQFISTAIEKLKASGEWAALTEKLDAPYDDWQP